MPIEPTSRTDLHKIIDEGAAMAMVGAAGMFRQWRTQGGDVPTAEINLARGALEAGLTYFTSVLENFEKGLPE